MNTNQKKLKLVKEGIKASTLNKMTDSQIDVLFSKLQEQVQQTQSATTVTTVGPEGGVVVSSGNIPDLSHSEFVVSVCGV